MTEKIADSSDPTLSKKRHTGIRKRLARFKNFWVKAFTFGRDPALELQTFWFAILIHEKERECPAPYFQKLSMSFRHAKNIASAERICTRGIDLYPFDLSLAIEYAEIARTAVDQQLRVARWQQVIHLAGDSAPLSAYINLTDCYRSSGQFDLAELSVCRGLEFHPNDFSLMWRRAGILAVNGSSTIALAAFRSLVEIHPDQDLEFAFLQMSRLLSNEGLSIRAKTVLQEGLAKYPSSNKLQGILAQVSCCQELSPKPLQNDQLFYGYLESLNRGILYFSLDKDALKQHVPSILNFAETITPPRITQRLPEVDVFAVWGAPSKKNQPTCELAAREGKLLLYLDSGFISSTGAEGENFPAHSVIACPDSAYFDATKSSFFEKRLNSDDYVLSDDQRVRSDMVIESVVSNRISKFNHAPRIDLSSRFPADGSRRILLVDQRKSGSSIHWSLGGPVTFERMLETALNQPNHEILVKLHPEVISGRFESSFRHLLPNPLPKNVILIDFDVNPFDLFDVVDEVFVCSSQLGFEAVLAGKQVHCFAAPFYAGWGFTTDHSVVPRRTMQRSRTEIFYLYYIEHSRYFIPSEGTATIEGLISYFIASRDVPFLTAEQLPTIPTKPLKILIIIPSGRFGATGRYLQNLSISLIQLGCEVMILAEGPCPRLESGVRWMTLEFEGIHLSSRIQREVIKFAPNFIYENGVRSRAQRTALEALMLTGARFVMQSEDDDIQVHRLRRGEAAADQLTTLDRPQVNTAEIADYLKNHDWHHSLHVLLDPAFNRWVEPLMRILCYRMACIHTAIWHPYAERLAREYGVPTLVIPPVACAADFQRIPMTPQERETTLGRYGIDPAATVIFIGGALYSYSDEFAVFLAALKLAALSPTANFALVVTSGRSSLPLGRMATEILGPTVRFVDIGDAVDIVYMEMLKACDIVCSPGLPDDFNRYRLPSRLVKAMAMAKPILTCRCGFGESLEHGGNAFLMDGADPAEWVASIQLTQDAALRYEVGKKGREFAQQHFEAPRVAAALKKQLELALTHPVRSLAAGIAFATGQPLRDEPSIRIPNGDVSPLRSAIRTLAMRTHRLHTVVHIGAGKCTELEDYCRLGAKQITLVEPLSELASLLKNFGGHSGSIVIKQVAVSGISSRREAHVYRDIFPHSNDQERLYLEKPTSLLDSRPSLQVVRMEQVETQTISEICGDLPLDGSDHLLVLNLLGLEVEALNATPKLLIRQFEWIAVHVTERPLFENGATSLQVKSTLKEFGFEYIPGAQDFSGLQVAALFRKSPELVSA